MIFLENISKQFSTKILFRSFSLQINDRDRIAFVGSNGSGKTTLMKIITEETSADSGRINRSRYSTFGYLPQDGLSHAGKTLYQEVESTFGDILALHRQAEELSHEINLLSRTGNSESPQMQNLMQELGRIQHGIEDQEGYNVEHKIKQVLFGLSFEERDLSRKTEEFSGGWQMRIGLAKLLLREPSVLLLDEPTNHLDIESLAWLESYLTSYAGALIVVSHDSRFLDTIVARVIDISQGNVTEYAGNYSAFIKQKAERLALLEATRGKQQHLITKTSRFIERFRYKATKARQVQGRIKMLEKLETIDIAEQEKTVSFRFPEPPRSGRIVLELNNIKKSYDEKLLFQNIALTIERGDRIALLGVNGSGKSTLARIIAGVETFQAGERTTGHNVTISYYAQNTADDLQPDKSVIETLEAIAPNTPSRELRTLLGCFLFTADDVLKSVSVLSGGEKSRLALAKMLFTSSNFLILDEPTNHLDIETKAILQERLLDYSGTYIIVSHDRDFLEPLINKVIAIRHGILTTFPGTVDEYLEYSQKNREETAAVISAKEDAAKSPAQIEKERKRQEAEKRQEYYRIIKPLKIKVEKTEQEIMSQEERKILLEGVFADQETYRDEKKIPDLQKEYATISARLEVLYEEWTKLQENIETIDLDLAAHGNI